MLFWFKSTWAKMIAFIESLKDDTCTPKPAKLNAWVRISLVSTSNKIEHLAIYRMPGFGWWYPKNMELYGVIAWRWPLLKGFNLLEAVGQ